MYVASSLSKKTCQSDMAQFQPQWRNLCCNPFNKPHHFTRKKSRLRVVTERMREKVPSILPGEICDSCRKQLAAESEQRSLPQEPSDSSPESDVVSPTDETFGHPLATLAVANKHLDAIGETPLTKRKLRSKRYRRQKFEVVTAMMQKAVLDDAQEISDDSEIIAQLKEKYSTADRSEKLQVLTVLPKSWSIRKIEAEFGASNRMARKAKELVREKGILSTPNPKPGHTLSQQTVDLVTSFYESDENSRLMPGKKDCVSVRTAEWRVNIQKRLVLSNLKELHRLFKDRFPGQKVGFSKFAELRPKHCVLAGASGTHSVCVCTIHQNVKLMIQSAKQGGLVESHEESLATYPPLHSEGNMQSTSTYLGTCNECPGFDSLKDSLHTAFDDNMIDTILHTSNGYQWIDPHSIHSAIHLMSLLNVFARNWSNSFHIPLSQFNRLPFSMNANVASSQVSCWFKLISPKTIHSFCKMLHRDFIGIIPKQLSIPSSSTIGILERIVTSVLLLSPTAYTMTL